MSNSRNGFAAFTAFKPRSVTANANANSAPRPAVPAGPALPPSFPGSQPTQPSYAYSQPQYSQPIRQGYQPYAAQSHRHGQSNPDYDPEAEAQAAQWQAAYTTRDEGAAAAQPASGAAHAGAGPTGAAAATAEDGEEKNYTVKRKGGGKSWADDSLLEWDPSHFRIFVGNLAGETTDESLLKGFSKYSSVKKARVIRDKHTTKSKGFGFVAFSNADEYFRASQEMQGKYIGSHPVIIKKAKTEVRPVAVRQNKDRKNNNNNNKHNGQDKNAGAGGSANTGAGVKKKPAKSRNGLKMLG